MLRQICIRALLKIEHNTPFPSSKQLAVAILVFGKTNKDTKARRAIELDSSW